MIVYMCLTKGLMAEETLFSLVLYFKASRSSLLAREGDPGS